MNNIIFALALSTIAGFSTLLGALFIYIKPKNIKDHQIVSFALSLSLIIMIGISLFDLLPESLKLISFSNKPIYILIIIPLFIISYLIIKALNKLLNKYENNLYKLGLISIFTLVMHNFPEGILTFLSSTISYSLGIKLSIAIAIHNIPEGLAIAVPIYYSTGSRKKAIAYAFLSGLAEPLGAICAYLLFKDIITPLLIGFILIIVSGLMITLAVEQMLPEATKKGDSKEVNLGFFIGGIILLLNFLI